MPTEPAFWFSAKRYGWGWGLPKRWQGWAVMAVYAALMAGGIFVVKPVYGLVAGEAVGVASTAGLLLVCWWKGEPPRWRWGKDAEY